MTVFAIIYEEKFSPSSSSSSTSLPLGISKYYSISIDGRDKKINDIVVLSDTLNFKFNNTNQSNGKYEIITTDKYMIYDFISDLRSEGFILISTCSSNNGNKEKYLFEFNDNHNYNYNKDEIDVIETNNKNKSSNSVFHSIKTIFTPKSNKVSNNINSSNSNSSRKQDVNEKIKTPLSISLSDNNDDKNFSIIMQQEIIQNNENKIQSIDDFSSNSNTPTHEVISERMTYSLSNQLEKKVDTSPVVTRKQQVVSSKQKIKQQLYAQHIANNSYPSPKTIATLAHGGNIKKAAATPSTAPKNKPLTPQRFKNPSENVINHQKFTPHRSPKRDTNNDNNNNNNNNNNSNNNNSNSNNESNEEIEANQSSAMKQLIASRSILVHAKKEPPLVLNELSPRKKYDLSLNLANLQDDDDDFHFKQKFNYDDETVSKNSLDILWS